MQPDNVDVSIHLLNSTLKPFNHGDCFFYWRVEDCPLDVDVTGPGRQVCQLQDESFELRMKLKTPGDKSQTSLLLCLDELCSIGLIEEGLAKEADSINA